MSRSARTRSRTTRTSGPGTVKLYYGPGYSTLLATYTLPVQTFGSETTVDSIGTMPYADSAFDSSKGTIGNLWITGDCISGHYHYVGSGPEQSANILLRMRSPWAYSEFQRTPKSDSVLATMAAASMNPSRPTISVGQDIGELHELPEAFLEAGRILLQSPFRSRVLSSKGLANANLLVQFGFLPLISDLVALVDFADAVARREQLLRDMSRGYKRFHRKLATEEWGGDSAPYLMGIPYFNLANNTYGRVHMDAKRTYWFTGRAKLNFAMTEREIQSRAWRVALEVDGSQLTYLAWELLPWSWLISWFSNTSALIHAWAGGIPWTWSGINVMHKTEYRGSVSYTNWYPGVHLPTNPPWSKASVLYRRQASPSAFLEFSTPYLVSNQWTILASIARKLRLRL